MGNSISPCAWPAEGAIVYSLKDKCTKSSLIKLGFTVNRTLPAHMDRYGRMNVPADWTLVEEPSHHESFRYWTVRDANGIPRVKVGGKVSDHDFDPEVRLLSEQEGKSYLKQSEEKEGEQIERDDPLLIFDNAIADYHHTVRKIQSDFPCGGGERFQPVIDNAYLEMERAFSAIPADRKNEAKAMPQKVQL